MPAKSSHRFDARNSDESHEVAESVTRVPPTPKLIDPDSRQFVILKKIGGVAMMGGCTGCGRKFFTPPTLFHDAFGADEYLRRKFDIHDCELHSRPNR